MIQKPEFWKTIVGKRVKLRIGIITRVLEVYSFSELHDTHLTFRTERLKMPKVAFGNISHSYKKDDYDIIEILGI